MLTLARFFGQYPYLLVIEYTVVSYEPSRHLPILNKEFPRLSSRVLELDATPHPPSFNVSLSVNTYAISNRVYYNISTKINPDVDKIANLPQFQTTLSKYIFHTKSNICFYRTRVRSLVMLVSNSLTHSLTD